MTKIKVSTICLLLLMVPGTFGAAALSNDNSDLSLNWRIVTEIAPPYQYYFDEQLTGIAVNQIRPVLNAAGISAPIEVFPWARAYELAKNRKNTLIFSMVRLQERESSFQWISLIEQTRLSFITTAENQKVFINRIDDAKRYAIGAVRNDFNHRYLLRQGFKEKEHFILRSSLSELVDLLFKGRIDVMLVNLTFLKGVLRENGLQDSDIKVHLEPENAIRDVYLAAHIDSDPKMVAQLRQLFSEPSLLKKSSQ